MFIHLLRTSPPAIPLLGIEVSVAVAAALTTVDEGFSPATEATAPTSPQMQVHPLSLLVKFVANQVTTIRCYYR